MKKKTAITLIELIVSITTASIIFILLGNIISKKLNATSLAYEKGTYYCWKDWDENLYQKTPMGSIQTVSSCRVKIPKNAKNIQVYLIGGGAGGNVYDNNSGTFLANEIVPHDPIETTCIEEKQYSENAIKLEKYKKLYEKTENIYTRAYDNLDYVTDLTGSDALEEIEAETKSLHSSFLDESYTKKVLSNGSCYMPIYKKRIKAYYKMPSSGVKYYSKGSNKETVPECIDAEGTQRSGTCYDDGFFKNSSRNDIDTNTADFDNVNMLELVTVNTSINLKDFKYPSYGEVIPGFAEAGKEYNITSGNIGKGGEKGGSGGDTVFGDFVAKGGSANTTELTVNLEIEPVSDVKNQQPKYVDVCPSTETKCNGRVNTGLKKNKIEIKADKVLSPQYNPKADSDEAIKTGFGLFGASGAAQDCQIKYYLIKSLKYNKVDHKIQDSVASFSCKNNETNGMGGAIIIRWE